MAIQCGIVGLPNVGKSTLFNSLTAGEIAAENYPFCTIEPNNGIVLVPDPRLQALAEIVKPKKTIPTTVEFVDIAGLVEGASKGEGLGNKFLANIRDTDAIAHVVRCFEDEDITHVSGQIDPASDIEVINTELALADLETVEKNLVKATRNAKTNNKEDLYIKQVLEKAKAGLDQVTPIRAMGFDDNEKAVLYPLHLLTAKRTLYIANVHEDGFENNPYLDTVRDIATKENADVVPVCAAIEAEIAQLDEEDKQAFLSDMQQDEPGLNRVIRAAYHLLGLQTYFTAGEKEVRAWTTAIGATAPRAAAAIHTDFEKGFIRAEVISYDDFIQYRGEKGAKETGKMRLEGKEYIVHEGDVMHFRFNV